MQHRIVSIALTLAICLVVVGQALAAPPALPSSFYGEIAIAGYTCTAETKVKVYLDGDADGLLEASEPLVATTSAAYNAGDSSWVYSLDVPSSPCTEGKALLFELSTPPLAQDDEATLDEDTSATINVLANDSDGVGQIATAVWHGGTNVRLDLTTLSRRGLSLQVTLPPSHGVAMVEGQALRYSPSADYCGSDAFTYSISDAEGRTAQAEVSLQVSCLNDAPRGLALNGATVEEGKPAGTAVGTFSASDPDANDALSFSLPPGEADNGYFALQGATLVTGATFAYDQRQAYRITVRAEDRQGAWCQGEFDISVVRVNEPPVLGEIADQVISQGEAFAPLDLYALVTDADHPDEELSWTFSGNSALSVEISSGLATITAPAGWDGAEVITFTATDPGGSSASASASFRVLARHTVTLQPGWNLVSFNVQPLSPDVAEVLASLEGRFDIVYAWNPEGGALASWELYDSDPDYLTPTLTTLDRSRGFWVHVTGSGPAELVVDGIAEGDTQTPMSAAGDGWNLVGYPSGTPSAVPQALGTGDYELAFAYDAEDQADPWKVYDVNAPTWACDLQAMAPGRGHWVKVSSPWTWQLTYKRPGG